MDKKISVVMNTYNAEKHLQQVLDSLKRFDEIVVCDMESTDSTVEIARNNGCKVVTFPKGNNNICEPARDFAIHSAANDWVFVVDADEIVPDALRDYLYERIGNPGFSSALTVPRINKFLGKPATASPDYQLRFFLKDKTTWPPTIHSRPSVNGKIENIPANRKDLYMVHLDDLSIKSRVDKMNVYSEYEVVKRAHKKYGVVKMLFRPGWFFIRSLIFGKGFLDGKRGLVRDYMASLYQIIYLSKLYENSIKNEQ